MWPQAIIQKRTRGLKSAPGRKERVENEGNVDQIHTGIAWGILKNHDTMIPPPGDFNEIGLGP